MSRLVKPICMRRELRFKVFGGLWSFRTPCERHPSGRMAMRTPGQVPAKPISEGLHTVFWAFSRNWGESGPGHGP